MKKKVDLSPPDDLILLMTELLRRGCWLCYYWVEVGFLFLVNSIQNIVWEEVTKSEILGESCLRHNSPRGHGSFLYNVYFLCKSGWKSSVDRGRLNLSLNLMEIIMQKF